MKIIDFGKTKSGQTAHLYVLENENVSFSVSDYGATLVEFIHKNTGIDVVLGFDDVSGYEKNKGYFGASIGRVANRIKGGRFTLNGCEYVLAKNDRGNHLHGGAEGFDKKMLKADCFNDRVVFTYFSPDGEEGYPGDLDVEISYELIDDGIRIISKGTAGDDTLFAYTNHSYFNIAGGGEITGHELDLCCDAFVPNDENALAMESALDAHGTAFDFRSSRRIGDAIMSDDPQIRLSGGIDHHFPVRGDGMRKMCCYTDGSLSLEMRSDFPGMHIYTPNFVEPLKGKYGSKYAGHAAVAFEAEYQPNAINYTGVNEKPIVRKGETLCHCIEFHLREERRDGQNKTRNP